MIKNILFIIYNIVFVGKFKCVILFMFKDIFVFLHVLFKIFQTSFKYQFEHFRNQKKNQMAFDFKLKLL